LVFFARDEQGTKISHVLIYVGNGKVIESSGHDFTSVSDVNNPEINENMRIKFEDFFVREKDIKDARPEDLKEIIENKEVIEEDELNIEEKQAETEDLD
jgi:anthranilate phosphoribosyltransferase